ncbi:response regulator [Hydrogenophaga sp. 5NK40-0174]|uniref:response regulator n=1 Tax=Hydrogenophaga sp. 5NK40-0174 TaxID=3127649 RepID=UPI003102009A
MSHLLIVDDDPGTLKLLTVVLRHQGYGVDTAETAEQAWDKFNSQPPDLVISDIHLPSASGLDLLARIRGDMRHTLCPVILLTSLNDRQHMRSGMQLGADDYITKPFRGPEIVEAVRAQLNRQNVRNAAQELKSRASMERALQEQAQTLGENYELQLAHTLSEQWASATKDAETERLDHACVASFGLVDHEAYVEHMPPDQMARWLKRFHEACGDAASLFGALNVHFLNEGAVAVFATDEDDPALNASSETASSGHAVGTATIKGELRALKAAYALSRSMAGIRDFVKREWPELDLPPPALAVGLHSGAVGLSRLHGLSGGAVITVPVGHTVNQATLLQKLSLRHRGTITMTADTLRQVTGATKVVKRELVTIAGQAKKLDVCWVTAPAQPS